MFEPKYVVRKGTLFNRRMLAAEVWKLRNEKICSFSETFLQENNIKNFHIFLPIKRNKEVDLWKVLTNAYKQGHQVVVSATDFEKQSMSHFIYSEKLVFEEDQFGIPTPKNGDPADLSMLQLVFIPMLAGDKLGNRVGYGKGYYDKMLADMPSSVMKVGVSLNPLFDQFTFAEEHDIAVDYCITPQEVIKCRS